MITPTAPIAVPASTADGLWLKSMTIVAPSPSQKVAANIRVVPWNSTTGEMFDKLGKTIALQDVLTLSATNLPLATAIQAIYAAVQDQVTSQNLF